MGVEGYEAFGVHCGHVDFTSVINGDGIVDWAVANEEWFF